MPSTFDLNCLVLGDDPSCLFPVKIAATESVGILRDAIKDKKKPELDHVAAGSLLLWKVSIPLNESFKNNLSKLDLVEQRPLLPEQELVEIFTGPPPAKRHVHIVVKAPPIGASA
jgi:Crinkler effector protein N-terminal domain